MRLLFRSAVLALFIAPATQASATSRENCYWVVGRLFTANGTPTFRIWPKGTKRLLGVVSRSGDAEAADILPPKVRRMNPSFDRSVWGDFRVCPLTAERAGWMRMVILVNARGQRATER